MAEVLQIVYNFVYGLLYVEQALPPVSLVRTYAYIAEP